MARETRRETAAGTVRLPVDKVGGVVGLLPTCLACGELIVSQFTSVSTTEVCDECFFEGLDDDLDEQDYDESDYD